MKRRVLLTGPDGQLGRALLALLPSTVECFQCGRSRLDITDRNAVLETVASLRPDLIFNAAAYTAVDQAEVEPGLAYAVNRDAVSHLAEASERYGARLIHVSTDYVFDGAKSSPYRTDDRPNPLNVYGASKLEGEKLALDRTEGEALVVRTAWVYSRGPRNFATTMMRLLRERKEVKVVDDQLGSPTYAADLASALWQLGAMSDARGLHHWTNAGVATWYDFACRIREAADSFGVAPLASIIPIPTSEYPTPARRPLYSVLDKASSWNSIGPAEHWAARVPAVVRPAEQAAG